MKRNKQRKNLTGKMKKPLNKRLIRELTGDIGKYIVIFILLVFSIGFVSGFFVAGESMIKAYNESFEKYNIETLMYEALKSYSQCKPGHKSFLDRMQFYAIKKQTEDEI